ncbi:restriction endonuclease subunit S [Bacillus pumilus]|uniref:restriction endonuclease subunit S n=1 Tax=Bacillus TaxID=1386 RepID=UPI000D038064|nr:MULTISPECIES: restriction endonuclease subunit S [Bacillus]MCK6164943.1 restriction endonuclease subunit S [Bacillus pumilus]MCK6185506.1 restriction endonuclease subunit S [Bacillus pumilus]PRS47700.1 restriction endonuclease subunit S [Bacillus sp. LNXM10]
MPTYKLKELVTEVISGEWGQEPTNKFSGVKVIRTTNFSNTGRLDLHREVVKREIESEKVNKKKLLVDDIIIEKSGGSLEQPVGRVVFFEETDIYLCNNFTSVLRPNKELVEPKYLMYLLFNLHKTRRVLKFQNKTTGIINLKLDQYLQQTEVIIPSKEVQQKIVKVLDKKFELINKRQSQITALDELTQSVFLEMFGDPVVNHKNLPKKKLGETGELKRGMSKHRPRNAPELLGGPYPLIQTGDVSRAGLFIENYRSTYSELGLKQSKMWEAGTLCITIAANIAETSILKFDACFPDSVVGYKPFENMNTIFVHYWFSFFQKILENSAPESAQKNINLKILKDIEIITPSIKQQNEFAYKVNVIYKQKVKLNEAKNFMEEMYNLLLHKAFKGELFQEQK